MLENLSGLRGDKVRRIISGAVCALILLNSGCEQYETSFQEDSASHSWPSEEWQTSSLEAEGIDPLPIARFVEEIESGNYGLVDHFLLIRNGRLVVDERFTQDYQAVSAKVRPEERIGFKQTRPQIRL